MEICGNIKADPALHSVKIVDMFEVLHVFTWVYVYNMLTPSHSPNLVSHAERSSSALAIHQCSVYTKQHSSAKSSRLGQGDKRLLVLFCALLIHTYHLTSPASTQEL